MPLPPEQGLEAIHLVEQPLVRFRLAGGLRPPARPHQRLLLREVLAEARDQGAVAGPRHLGAARPHRVSQEAEAVVQFPMGLVDGGVARSQE
jgi:hypothetical protein